MDTNAQVVKMTKNIKLYIDVKNSAVKKSLDFLYLSTKKVDKEPKNDK